MSPEVAALAGFALVMALGQFSPGPDMLWLTRVSLRDGARDGVVTALGIATGLAVHATLALTGLALFLHRHPALQIAFTVAAAGYLGWLAARILRDPAGGGAGKTGGGPRGRPFLRGLFCNLANPKVALFLAAICTPFLESSPAPWFAVALWAVIVVQGGVLWSLWALLLQTPRARAIYQRHARRADVVFASVLAALAAWLVIRLVAAGLG